MIENYIKEADRVTYLMPKEVDHHCAGQIIAELDALIEGCGVRKIVFDMKQTEFMDSSGIAVVLGAQRNLLGAGQTFCVIRTPPSAMRIFKAAGIQKRVQFLPDLPTLHLEEEEPVCAGK